MDPLDRHQLVALATLAADPCVSIFQPLAGGGTADRKDPIRIKNLLRRAGEELAARGYDEPTAAAVLAPLGERLAAPGFWSVPPGGLALFAAPGFVRAVRVGFRLEEKVSVGDRFQVKPLLPLLEEPERFHVLALSLNRVRALAVSGEEVKRLEPDDLPESFAAMGYEQYESGVQWHSGRTSRLGRSTGVFHGHGDGDEEHFKEDVLAFFRRVAGALEREIGTDGQPLVLAAVAPHHALFERATSQLRLADDGIFGNPDELADAELAARGRDIVAAQQRRRRDGELERWRELRGSGRGVDDFEEIVRAADQGRVEVLFVARDAEGWGSYEPDLGRVRRRDEPEPGDVDLLDLAAARTLAQGGRVFTLEREAMPQGRAAVATLRYAIAA